MMSAPGPVQFGVAKVISLNHLSELVMRGIKDYLVRSAGSAQEVIIERSGGGFTVVHHRQGERCDRIAPDRLRATYVAGWVQQGQLYYRAV
ncbi:MAG: hypothetical protein ACOZCP_19295 [Pseudomonadota bacterium]|jgi:hypothetical protein